MIDWSSGNWHIGYLIAIPALTLVVLVLVAATVACLMAWRRTNDFDMWGIPAFGAGALAAIAIVSLIFALWPMDSTFHKYYHVTGKVEQVSSRMIAAGKSSMEQRFVVVLDGKPFAIDDTRASLLKVGDDVSLQCSREYQYAGDSGWSCEWGQQ